MNRSTLAGAICALVLLVTPTGSLRAQALEPIRYTLRFPAPQTHYVDVEARFRRRGERKSRSTWRRGRRGRT